MSLTLATVADALIEFILSLLRDPEVAAEFDEDPEQALAVRGLQHAGPSDVAAVAPVIIERTQVVHVAVPKPVPVAVERDHSPVVHQIKQVTSHLQWVDDRDTIVDQSVNQNIWAEGDVTQTFDNEAIVASGDEAVAAGADATVDKTWDDSTTIEAGEDVNIGNDTDVEVIEDSLNEDTDASTTTDESTTIVVEDSLDESSEETSVDGSFNDTQTSTETSTSSAGVVVVETTDDAGVAAVDAAPVEQPMPEQPAADQQVVEQQVVEQPMPEQPVEEYDVQPAPENLDPAYDAAAQYVEVDLADDAGDVLSDLGTMGTQDGVDDDTY